jgi:hypothetical protein
MRAERRAHVTRVLPRARHERYRVRSNRLARADRIDAFVRLSFDAHLSGVARQRIRKVRPNRLHVRRQPWALRNDHDVHVHHRESPRPDNGGCLAQQLETVGTFPGRIVVWEVTANVAGAGSPEKGVGHSMAHCVGVRVAEQPLVERNAHSAQNQRTAGNEPMQIVPVPDSQCGRAAFDTQQMLGGRQILWRRNLQVPRIALDQTDLVPGVLCEHGFVGRIQVERECVAQDWYAKRLWRLRQVDPVARQRLGNVAGAVGPLDGIARRNGGYGGAESCSRPHGSRDEGLAHQWACRIVNDHQVGSVRDAPKSVRHGILTPIAAGDNADRLTLSDEIRRDILRDLEWKGNRQIGYRTALEERLDTALQDGNATKPQKLFALGAAKAGPLTRSDDDGGNVQAVRLYPRSVSSAGRDTPPLPAHRISA